jgi:hypothetical protein
LTLCDVAAPRSYPPSGAHSEGNEERKHVALEVRAESNYDTESDGDEDNEDGSLQEGEMDPLAVQDALNDVEEPIEIKESAPSDTPTEVTVRNNAGAELLWKKADPIVHDARLNAEDALSANAPPRLLFNQGEVEVFVNGLGNIPSTFGERAQQPFLSYFLLAFPLDSISRIITATNANIPDGKSKLDCKSFFVFLGILVAFSLGGSDTPRKEHFEDEPGALFSGLNLRRFMPHATFEHFLKYFVLDTARTNLEKRDRWFRFRRFIESFSARMQKVISPGPFICVDESMVGWQGFGDWHVEKGMPHVTKIIRKPTPVGCEIKTLSCATSNILLTLELQEDKAAMSSKQFVGQYSSAGTSAIIRLAKAANVCNTSKVIVADSAFASVKTARACLEHGLHFIGLVKTAHSLYPKKFLNAVQLERGETYTMECKEEKLIAHTWADKKRKSFVSTCGVTTDGQDYCRQRFQYNEQTGKMYRTERRVKRSRLAQDYFENATSIDLHNRYRAHFGLELTLKTRSWEKRMFSALLGMVLTNAYLMYKLDHEQSSSHFHRRLTRDQMSRREFTKQIAQEMLHNRIRPGHSRFSSRLNRGSLDNGSEEDTENEETECVFNLISKHSSSSNLKKPEGRQLRCSVCGTRASFYCSSCSATKNRLIAVCGPLTGRPCERQHEINK